MAEAALAERRREAELKAQTRVAELEAEGKASAHKAWEEKRRQVRISRGCQKGEGEGLPADCLLGMSGYGVLECV